MLDGQNGKRFLYLVSADEKLSMFDVTHPGALRELSSCMLASSEAQFYRVRLISNQSGLPAESEADDRVAMVALSEAALKEIAPRVTLSDAASEEIGRHFKGVDAYAVDENKRVLYVAQRGELTVIRFNHPISRDAELFEESYENR